MFALGQTLTRKLRGAHWLQLTLWQFAGGGLIGAAAVPFAWTTPGAFDLGLMALVGIVSMVSFILITRALALARAAVLAPLQYSAILWAALMGFARLARRAEPADRHRQRGHHRRRALSGCVDGPDGGQRGGAERYPA